MYLPWLLFTCLPCSMHQYFLQSCGPAPTEEQVRRIVAEWLREMGRIDCKICNHPYSAERVCVVLPCCRQDACAICLDDWHTIGGDVGFARKHCMFCRHRINARFRTHVTEVRYRNRRNTDRRFFRVSRVQYWQFSHFTYIRFFTTILYMHVLLLSCHWNT